MTIVKDPEGNETRILAKMVQFHPLEVLEVGCGDSRMTWQYADLVGRITGIDPSEKPIDTARTNIPDKYRGQIDFVVSSLENYCRAIKEPKFDLVLFSWSL